MGFSLYIHILYFILQSYFLIIPKCQFTNRFADTYREFVVDVKEDGYDVELEGNDKAYKVTYLDLEGTAEDTTEESTTETPSVPTTDDIIDHVSNCGGVWTHEELVGAGWSPEDVAYQVSIGTPKGTTYTTKTHYKYIEVGTGKYYCDKCYHTKQ